MNTTNQRPFSAKQEFCAYLRRLIGDLYEDGITETAIDFKTALQFIEQDSKFIEQVFEVAFGDDAINRDYSTEEVLEELKSNSDKAWGIK